MSEPADGPALWSRRFLESLTAIGLGSTWLPRRRTAPPPQLLSFSLSTSVVVALLEAPGDEPYRARIAMRAFSAAEWARIQRELARRTRYAAKLLAGELPRDIEAVFDDLDLPLLPRSSRDIAMDCSCPHWEVPCEHLVAVCGRLAETFDADPFDILVWRGRDRSELLERLVSARTARASRRPTAGSAERPLADCLDSFWGSELPPPPPATPPLAESIRKPDLLLDQVTPPNVRVHGQSIVDLLRPLYNTITSVNTESDGEAART